MKKTANTPSRSIYFNRPLPASKLPHLRRRGRLGQRLDQE